MPEFVIVGGGLAGHRAALELRARSADARITLVGEEAELPYDRPPLAKGFLTGEVAHGAIMLADQERYDKAQIDFRGGVRAERIDRAAKRVELSDGGTVGYDRMVLTTGSRARLLEGVPPSTRIHYLRTLSDAVRLREPIARGGRILVVGGGFIGLEVAAAARSMGCEVVLVEVKPKLVSRAMPDFVADFLDEVHSRRGVRIALGHQIRRISETGEGVVCETEREVIKADCAVIGIGIQPNTELAEDAGLLTSDGIVVDRLCRTSDPDIFAAGEVTSFPNRDGSRFVRQESWRVASDQPKVAAANMCGQEATFDDVAWMWTDQYGLNIQSLGDVAGGERFLIRTDEHPLRWVLISIGPEGRVSGAIATNSGKDISMLRRVMRANQPLPEDYRQKFSAFGPADQAVWLEEFRERAMGAGG